MTYYLESKILIIAFLYPSVLVLAYFAALKQFQAFLIVNISSKFITTIY
jgi:hypothetical protein